MKYLYVYACAYICIYDMKGGLFGKKNKNSKKIWVTRGVIKGANIKIHYVFAYLYVYVYI